MIRAGDASSDALAESEEVQVLVCCRREGIFNPQPVAVPIHEKRQRNTNTIASDWTLKCQLRERWIAHLSNKVSVRRHCDILMLKHSEELLGRLDRDQVGRLCTEWL